MFAVALVFVVELSLERVLGLPLFLFHLPTDKTRQGKTRQDKTRQGTHTTIQDKTRQHKTRQHTARQDNKRHKDHTTHNTTHTTQHNTTHKTAPLTLYISFPLLLHALPQGAGVRTSIDAAKGFEPILYTGPCSSPQVPRRR
jgi:hypothetical protein